MKPVAVIIVIVLFAAGIGGGYYFTQVRGAGGSPSTATPAADDRSAEHGKSITVPDDATICSVHRVPEIICPFCNPSLIEERGWCGAHDVPEALCTRCSPSLIAAFKAENDWCAEHGVPESQCLICNPASDG